MENKQITNKELFYHYAESLGIKINDAQRLMVLALASKNEVLPQFAVIKSVCERCLNEKELKVCNDCYCSSRFE